MKKLFKKILGIIALAGLTITGTVFASQLPTSVPSTFSTYLSNQQATTDTIMSLANGTLRDGTNFTGYQCVTVDANTPTQEYECGMASGTSMTGLSRGLDAVTGTTTLSSLVYAHRRGATVSVTDYPVITIVDRILNGSDTLPLIISYATSTATTSLTAYSIVPYSVIQSLIGLATSSVFELAGTGQNITGQNTFSNTQTFSATQSFTSGAVFSSVLPTTSIAPTGPTQLANKAYVDSVAISGSPIATNISSGIGRVASSTQLNGTNSGTSTPYFIPSSLASSTASTTASILVATNVSTGQIDSSFIPSQVQGTFGNGILGNVTIAANSTTTLTSDAYYNNLTVNGGLITNGWKIYVKGTLNGTGDITWGTANNGSNGSGLVGGAGGTASTSGEMINIAGGAGGAGVNNIGCNTASQGTSVIAIHTLGNIGGTGGISDSSCTAGTSATSTSSTYFGILRFPTIAGVDFGTSSYATYYSSGGGGGGGGHAQNGSASSGAGGGGGASGGTVFILANIWSGSFQIVAVGGNGGTGAGASSQFGGGGGGGSGGTSVVIYGTDTWTGSYNLTGGLGGASGGGSAVAGSAGQTGASFAIPIVNLL